MLVKLFLCTLLLIPASLAVSAETEADQHCPKLPADSGLVWAYEQGPDFDVCYANNSKENEPKVTLGVYLGNFPQFSPKGKKPEREGKLNGASVQWYKKDLGSSSGSGLETLLYKGTQPVAHIWLIAQDEKSLSKLLAISEKLRIP